MARVSVVVPEVVVGRANGRREEGTTLRGRQVGDGGRGTKKIPGGVWGDIYMRGRSIRIREAGEEAPFAVGERGKVSWKTL